jgi:hypothetical protein
MVGWVSVNGTEDRRRVVHVCLPPVALDEVRVKELEGRPVRTTG